MPEDMTTAVELPFRVRVRHGVRRTHNWVQLIRFATVGGSGYVVNLVAFGLAEMVLIVLVSVAGFSKVAAQAVAIVSGTPLSFLGQTLWSFRA